MYCLLNYPFFLWNSAMNLLSSFAPSMLMAL